MTLSMQILLPVVLLLLFAQGLPVAQAQNWDEACQELRALEAELQQESDPQIRQMIEAQLGPLRRQCAPGFNQPTAQAGADVAGQYRLIADQTLEANQGGPGFHSHVVEVRHAVVEFNVVPNQGTVQGHGSMQYVSTNGSFTVQGCSGNFTTPPLKHAARASGQLVQQGQAVTISIDDLNTGGLGSQMQVNAQCPGEAVSAVRGMMPDESIFIHDLPLKNGATVTQVLPVGGFAKFTVKATLQKL